MASTTSLPVSPQGLDCGCDQCATDLLAAWGTQPPEVASHPNDYPTAKLPTNIESDDPARIDLTNDAEMAKWRQVAKADAAGIAVAPRPSTTETAQIVAWAKALRISADTFAPRVVATVAFESIQIADVVRCLQALVDSHTPSLVDPPTFLTLRKRVGIYVKVARRAVAAATQKPSKLSQRELAERLVDVARGRALYHKTRGWMANNGRVWYEGSTEIKRLVRQVLVAAAIESNKEKLEGGKPAYSATVLNSASTDSAVMKLAETVLAMPEGRQFDEDHWLLSTPLGPVDLRTGLPRKAPTFATMSAAYFSRCTSVAPAAAARCPLWLEVLDTTFKANVNVIAFIKRWFGYCLTGSTLAQSVLLFHGTGNNGKSIVMETMATILASYAMSSSPRTFTEGKGQQAGGAPSPDISRFEGVRYLRVPEVPDEAVLNMALIKSLSGGETLSARALYKNISEFVPLLKMVLSFNIPPTLKAVDKGTARRLLLVPFKNTIPDDKVDRDLMDKLKAEHSGILRWAIEGAVEYHKIGLAPPDEILKPTKNWLDDESGILDWIDEYCDLGDPNYTATQVELCASRNAWLSRRRREQVSQKRTAADLDTDAIKKLGIVWRQGGRRSASRAVYYTGVRLKPSLLPDEET